MTDDQEIWVDQGHWSESWESLEKLSGGGQGLARRARRKCDGRVAFLKVIKAKRDQERRARFFREASVYDTIRAPGIPRLLESNAHRWADAGFEPYVATDFVEGPTLTLWRESQTHVALRTAMETARKLLAILSACHANGVVHRDVKPDNIILADGDPGRPVLLDFGLNYHESEHASFATEHGQEIGNRFLRLPELSAGSPLKQDPRSDLSFVAGILFHMLTGQNPDVLQDAEGRLPHQRHERYATIRQVAGDRSRRLLAVFDSAFAPHIADRFTNAQAMLEALDSVMTARAVGRSREELRRDIREMMDTGAARRRAETHGRLQEALREIQRVHDNVRESLELPLDRVQSGWSVSGGLGRNTLGWRERGSDDAILSVKCEVREAGDEIVISLSGEPVFRTSISVPRYGNQFEEAVNRWLLMQLRDTLSNPDALPSEAHNFREDQPSGSLEDARAEAIRRGRNILAFVYDPTQEERGRLQHGLGYFLQNRKTRETINAAFIVALVPLSQVAAVTKILDNESMESSRWIVFDPHLDPLEQQVIRANPQEGERIALDLANRFGS